MAENLSNSGCDLNKIREAVCIHTGKIMDSCLDKDCIEDLRVYLTAESQAALEQSTSTKARCAELLDILLDVQQVSFNHGYYSIDITYYYKIIADAVICGTKPVTIYGLAVFGKRVVLCGGEGSAQVFSSRDRREQGCRAGCAHSVPEAIVEALDPMLLSARVMDVCDNCRCGSEICDIPASIRACFDSDLVTTGENRRLYVTLGQFSIVRLQRDTQLLIPSFDYCIPDKECCETPGCEETPCEAFGRIEFPTEAFYPKGCCTPLQTPSCQNCR